MYRINTNTPEMTGNFHWFDDDDDDDRCSDRSTAFIFFYN